MPKRLTKEEFQKKVKHGHMFPKDGIPFSEKMRRRWASKSDEYKKNFSLKCKKAWERKPKHEKLEHRQKISNTWKSKTKEEFAEINRKAKITWSKKPKSELEALSQLKKEIWNNKSEEEKLEHKQKISNVWKNKTKEELKHKAEKTRESWRNKSEEEFREFVETMKLVRSEKSDEELEEWNMNILKSKRENGTFNISQPEEDMYEILLTKFDKSDVIRQYKDKRYPFACDFYIKSEDLFIELNASWTHGGHWFDENNKEDLDVLKIWKYRSKTSKYYKSAIKVWTKKDIEKRSYLEKLNNRVFWDNNLKDFKKWFDKI